MLRWDGGRLSAQQAELVSSWLHGPVLIADLSWGQVDTKVLQVRAGCLRVIVKAAGPDNRHLGREITAHTSYTRSLVEQGRAGQLLYSSRELNLLVLEYLDGELVEGTGGELAEDIHFQAGGMLRSLHGQARRLDEEYEFRATAKTIRWLDRQHGIEPHVEREVRCRLAESRPQPLEPVPTHGAGSPGTGSAIGAA